MVLENGDVISVSEKNTLKNKPLLNKMDSTVLGVIPLCGTASRMKGIPKYLLPCKVGSSLLDNAIEIFKENGIRNVIMGLSELNNIILRTYNPEVDRIVLTTRTMAETVREIVSTYDETHKNYKSVMIMPDTYFILKDEVKEMIALLNKYDIVVIVWKIKDYQIGKVGQCKLEEGNIVDVIDKDKNCTYPYFWGMIGWNSYMNHQIDSEWETIGNLIRKAIDLGIEVKTIVSESTYYDCGTFSEYFTMIKNET